jgi:hypothetical protein
MLANYKINLSTFLSATTATTLNIPIQMEYQIVDNTELIERVFVDKETQNAVNPILDYDKVRYLPFYQTSEIINVRYELGFLNSNGNLTLPSYYSTIGFQDIDIKAKKNSFKESYLYLGFYDSDNAMTQNLVSEIIIYSNLTRDDYYPAGIPKPNIAGQIKPANQIPVRFVLSNPQLIRNGNYEGYHIYAYKDDVTIDLPKYLYMKASYFNGKTGKSINLMTDPSADWIDGLVNKLHTRYKLYRTTNGFYYEIDTGYSNNVTYTKNAGYPNSSDVLIKLYEIQAL